MGEDSIIRMNQTNWPRTYWKCIQDWLIFSYLQWRRRDNGSKAARAPSVGVEPLPWASWGLPPTPPSSCCSGPWDLLEHQTAGVPFDHKGSMLRGSSLNISKHQFCIFLTTGHSHRPFFLLIKVPESLLLANPVNITCFPGMRTEEPWGIEVKWGGGPEFKSQLCATSQLYNPVASCFTFPRLGLPHCKTEITVSSSLTLVLKMQCFCNMNDLLENNLSITQISNLLMCVILSARSTTWTQKSVLSSSGGMHKTHVTSYYLSSWRGMCHTHSIWGYNFPFPYKLSSFHSDSQDATLQT